MMFTVQELQKGAHNAKSVPLLLWILLTPALMSLSAIIWFITSGLGIFQFILTGITILITIMSMFGILSTVD